MRAKVLWLLGGAALLAYGGFPLSAVDVVESVTAQMGS